MDIEVGKQYKIVSVKIVKLQRTETPHHGFGIGEVVTCVTAPRPPFNGYFRNAAGLMQAVSEQDLEEME